MLLALLAKRLDGPSTDHSAGGLLDGAGSRRCPQTRGHRSPEGVTYRRYVASQRVKSRGVPNGLNPLVCPMGAVRSRGKRHLPIKLRIRLNLCSLKRVRIVSET